MLNLKTLIQFASYKVKQEKYKKQALINDMISFYIAILIENLPKFSLIYQNMKNPLSWVNNLNNI